METCKIKNLYNLEETIAKDLFEGAVYPWEVLPKISDFIKKLGATLSEEEYEKGRRIAALLQKKIISDMYEVRATTISSSTKTDNITKTILDKLANVGA